MAASSGSRGLCRDAWGQTINGDKNERTVPVYVKFASGIKNVCFYPNTPMCVCTVYLVLPPSSVKKETNMNIVNTNAALQEAQVSAASPTNCHPFPQSYV